MLHLLPVGKQERVSRGGLTSVRVVQEDELLPVVVVEQGEQRAADGRPQLQGELALALGGEAGRDEGDVQRAAERRQRVHRPLVVQAEDGEDTAGILRANCGQTHNRGQSAAQRSKVTGLGGGLEHRVRKCNFKMKSNVKNEQNF